MIEVINNDKEIIIKVSGRLTSDNYLELDKAFLSINDEGVAIILSLSDLEYISSAGLRTLLAEEKRLKAKDKHLIIRGCNSSIMDVFHISGFDQILKIEEAGQLYDTTNLELIGEGLCSKVYKISDDTILKCYEKNYDLSMVENEKKNSREALILGVPTAISLDVVKTTDGRTGIVFELLHAKALKSIFIEQYPNIEPIVKKYVELIKTVHTAKGNPDVLNYTLSNQLEEIKKCPYITDEEKQKAYNFVSKLDKGFTCIHGDFHGGNVMESDGELLFIDMGDFAIGNPNQDLAQVFNMLKKETHPGFAKMMTGLDYEKRILLYNLFMKHYFNNPSEEELIKIENEIEKYMFARQFFFINNFESTRESNLKYVREYLENIK